MKKHIEPFWWTLFGAGGAISALFLPALLFFTGLAFPLGWVKAPTHEYMLMISSGWYSRAFVFLIIALSLFHWAHRFRFTLYEGLQLHHFNLLIAVLCYGTALFFSGFAAYSLWTFW